MKKFFYGLFLYAKSLSFSVLAVFSYFILMLLFYFVLPVSLRELIFLDDVMDFYALLCSFTFFFFRMVYLLLKKGIEKNNKNVSSSNGYT